MLPEYALLDEWALWLEIWVRALRDPQLAKEREALDRRWTQTLADVIRYGKQTGEFAADEIDPEDVAIELGTMMDGMAIQVLLNDPAISSDRMHRIALDAARRLLGYAA